MTYYGGRLFRPSGEDGPPFICPEIIYDFKQKGAVLTIRYSGGKVTIGQALGFLDKKGIMITRFQHLTHDDDFISGTSLIKPEILSNGKIKLHDNWSLFDPMNSRGTSHLDEV